MGLQPRACTFGSSELVVLSLPIYILVFRCCFFQSEKCDIEKCDNYFMLHTDLLCHGECRKRKLENEAL